MSKSDADRLSSILLTDSADTVREKLRKAITDMTPSISYDPATRPGVSNLVEIAAAFGGSSEDEVCRSAAGFDTLAFKNHVADVVIERLRPIAAEIARHLDDVPHLKSVISDGNERANNIARETYSDVCKRVGFL